MRRRRRLKRRTAYLGNENKILRHRWIGVLTPLVDSPVVTRVLFVYGESMVLEERRINGAGRLVVLEERWINGGG